MPPTKALFTESIQKKIYIPNNNSKKIVESCIEIMKSALESGDDVLISGFGKFCIKEKGVLRAIESMRKNVPDAEIDDQTYLF